MTWQTRRAIERKYEALPKPRPDRRAFFQEQTKLAEEKRNAKIAKMFDKMRKTRRG
jgi:hypothetical protein